MGKIRSFTESGLKMMLGSAKQSRATKGGIAICRYASGLVYWHNAGLPLPPHCTSLAEQFCVDLNKELHHDGKWTVTWDNFNFDTGEYTRLTFSFFDEDDDLQFHVHNEQPFIVMFSSMGDLMEHCEDAWKAWRETLKINDIRQKDTIKAALGQQSADPLAQPSLIHSID